MVMKTDNALNANKWASLVALVSVGSRGSGHHAADGRSGGPGGDASGARAVVTVKTSSRCSRRSTLSRRRQALWTRSSPLPCGRRTSWPTSSAPPRRRSPATSRATSRNEQRRDGEFKALIDEEVDTMTGQVQDDHRITEPAAAEPAPRSRSRSSPPNLSSHGSRPPVGADPL